MSEALGDAEMSALFAPEAELQRYLRIEAAWTRSLGDIEGASNAEAIAFALEASNIVPEDLAQGVAQDGLPIPGLVRHLKTQFSPDEQTMIHRGLTSQDVMDTSVVLALREALELILTRLQAIEVQLKDMQDRFDDATVMSYTRMQPAHATSATEAIARWRQSIPGLLKSLRAARTDVSQVQWGGPIGTRDHPQAKALGAAFARHLDLSDPGQSWHTDRTAFVDAGHVMTKTGNAMGKIGEDIALMAALGPDHITFSGGSSSAMPHKNNPVAAEIAIALADHCINLNASLSRSTRHEGFRSGRAWSLEWLALPQICLAVGAATIQISRALRATKTIGTTLEI